MHMRMQRKIPIRRQHGIENTYAFHDVIFQMALDSFLAQKCNVHATPNRYTPIYGTALCILLTVITGETDSSQLSTMWFHCSNRERESPAG